MPNSRADLLILLVVIPLFRAQVARRRYVAARSLRGRRAETNLPLVSSISVLVLL